MKLSRVANNSASLLIFSLGWFFIGYPLLVLLLIFAIPPFNTATSPWLLDTEFGISVLPTLLGAAWALKIEITAKPVGRKQRLTHIFLLTLITLVLLLFMLLIAGNVWFALNPMESD